MEMKREDAVDVLFIAMPFCDEYMPCLTLALFKSVLARAGIKSRVQHEYLYYASRIGLEKYRSIMQVCTIGYGHDYFACETILARRLTAKRFLLLKITYAGCRESICRGKSLPAGSGRIPCIAWISFRKPMRWRKRT